MFLRPPIAMFSDLTLFRILPWVLGALQTTVGMPLSALGLGSGSGLGLDSAATTSGPSLPPSSAVAPPHLPPASTSAPAPEGGAKVSATPSTSPQRSQQAGHQLERNNRTLGGPENHRTPSVPSLPSIRPTTFNGHQYTHLPAHLADQLASLPPLPAPQRRSCHSHGTAALSSVSFTF